MQSIHIVEAWGWTGVTGIISHSLPSQAHPPWSFLSPRAAGYKSSVCTGNWLIIKITCQTKANAFIIRCPPQVRHRGDAHGCTPSVFLNKTCHVEINDMSQMCSDTFHKADYTLERTKLRGKQRLRLMNASASLRGTRVTVINGLGSSWVWQGPSLQLAAAWEVSINHSLFASLINYCHRWMVGVAGAQAEGKMFWGVPQGLGSDFQKVLAPQQLVAPMILPQSYLISQTFWNTTLWLWQCWYFILICTDLKTSGTLQHWVVTGCCWSVEFHIIFVHLSVRNLSGPLEAFFKDGFLGSIKNFQNIIIPSSID